MWSENSPSSRQPRSRSAAPCRARYGHNDEAIIFEDGTAAVRGSGRKWYVEGSDGKPDLSQPVELVNNRMERLRKGNDGGWYIVGDDGKLELGRPVELVNGRWVEPHGLPTAVIALAAVVAVEDPEDS